MKKMNGWFAKYLSVIIQIIIVAAVMIAAYATVIANVDHIETDVATLQISDDKQDECITEINRSLGRIEGKIDTLIDGGG